MAKVTVSRTAGNTLVTLGLLFSFILAYFGVEGAELEQIGTLSGLVILTMGITQVIKVKAKLEDVVWFKVKAPHVIASAVSIGLALVGDIFNIGYFANISAWYYSILVGLLMSFAASGLFTYEMMKAIVEAVFGSNKK